MSKIHTTVRVGVDGSLTLPAFFMRGMGYEPGKKFPSPPQRTSTSATVTQTASGDQNL